MFRMHSGLAPNIVANALVIYLQSVRYREHGRTYKADTHFVTYTTGRHFHPFRDKSGAYTFIPDGAAKVSTYLFIEIYNILVVILLELKKHFYFGSCYGPH